jgi:hypothetical protein
MRGQIQEGQSFPDREPKTVQSREYRGRNVFLGIDEDVLTKFLIYICYTSLSRLILKLHI